MMITQKSYLMGRREEAVREAFSKAQMSIIQSDIQRDAFVREATSETVRYDGSCDRYREVSDGAFISLDNVLKRVEKNKSIDEGRRNYLVRSLTA